MPFIDKYFTEDNSTYAAYGITAYVFDDKNTAQFIRECIVPFREAYIKEAKLVEIVKVFGTTRKHEIEERIPKTADVKAGDFGEILTYYLAREIWCQDANICPMKWRLKDKKDAASPFTDVLIFRSDVNGANPNDELFSFEAKVRATAPSGNYDNKIGYKAGKAKCAFIDAIIDADKDRVSRAAESINYLLTRCKDLGLTVEYKQIIRFAEPYNNVTYKKQYSAVVIVDSKYTARQLAKLPVDLLVNYPNIRVYFVPIKDLKVLYENVFTQLPNA